MTKVTYKIGNLVHAFKMGYVSMIAHQANCFSRMKSGVAKDIVASFPEVAKRDALYANNVPEDKFGHADFVKTECGHVVNLYGQFRYGRDKQYTNYDALRSALAEMNKIISICSKRHVVGIPKIGAGLGGGDWKVIENIINEEIQSCDVVCYVLKEEDVPEWG